MKKLVISTGAGMSAESGISTFRDAGGLWENYPVMDVASAEGYQRNPELIHKFYNERRAQLISAEPNQGHRIIADLERMYQVYVITQNVDNLHERAGSTNVLHLHGELMKARAVDDESITFELTPESYVTSVESLFEGHRVRPHIVFFGEAVPNFEPATRLAAEADIFVIIGTSLVVYPAAALLHYVRKGVPVYYIDPNPAEVPEGVTVLRCGATEGLQKLAGILGQ